MRSSTRFRPKRPRRSSSAIRPGSTPRCLRGCKERGRALCVADSEKLETPLEVTADFGYFRLRDEGYQPSDIEEWARKIAPLRERCKDIYVYFKHEEQGIGPEFARQADETPGIRDWGLGIGTVGSRQSKVEQSES